LSEPSDPVVFSPADVPANAHPQGIAIVSNAGGSASAAGVGPGLAGAMLTLVQVQGIGFSSQLAPINNSAAVDSQLALDSTGRLPFVGSSPAGTAATFPQGLATSGEVSSRAGRDGHRLDLSELNAARLDALFGSAVGAAVQPFARF